MFQITVKQGLFGPSVSGLGKVVKVGNSIATQITVKSKVLTFRLAIDPSTLLRSMNGGCKVTHKQDGLAFTFVPVYA